MRSGRVFVHVGVVGVGIIGVEGLQCSLCGASGENGVCRDGAGMHLELQAEIVSVGKSECE